MLELIEPRGKEQAKKRKQGKNETHVERLREANGFSAGEIVPSSVPGPDEDTCHSALFRSSCGFPCLAIFRQTDRPTDRPNGALADHSH